MLLYIYRGRVVITGAVTQRPVCRRNVFWPGPGGDGRSTRAFTVQLRSQLWDPSNGYYNIHTARYRYGYARVSYEHRYYYRRLHAERFCNRCSNAPTTSCSVLAVPRRPLVLLYSSGCIWRHDSTEMLCHRDHVFRSPRRIGIRFFRQNPPSRASCYDIYIIQGDILSMPVQFLCLNYAWYIQILIFVIFKCH